MSLSPLFPDVSVRRPVAAVNHRPVEVILERLAAIPKLAEVKPASRLEVRLAPEMVSTGVAAIDELTGGLPRGCLSEVCGTASSGRTSLLLAVLAAATRREEACALVDVSDSLDPVSAATAGVNFENLLWVRCGAKINSPRSPRDPEKNKNSETPLDQALRVMDLLLQSGGFGMVIMDLGDVPFRMARRIPLASWFRFQRVVEPAPTVLLVITQEACAKSCASLLLKMKQRSAFGNHRSAKTPSHAELLEGFQVSAEVLRSRLQRKPSRSSVTAFTSKAVRVG